jgi:UDP-N-acetylmuramoyl-tripeptide--D-alanyl-D-alanine ligase
MISLSLRDVARAVGGHLVGRDATFSGVSTDTRTLKQHELFVALKGERFDGHDSLADAFAKGASGAIVARDDAGGSSIVRVADTRKALGQLANWWRRRHVIPVIGITGSNGKTSTKEMTAGILRQRFKVLATGGNLNNDIGVPQTLFGLGSEHTVAVIEMGANRMNDIADLAAIAQPTIGVVTMCGPAHLEGFGDLEGVATAKGKMFSALAATGTAVINADDAFSSYWQRISSHAKRLLFGINARSDFSATHIVNRGVGAGSRFTLQTPAGHIDIDLPLDGQHNIYNALAAAAAATTAGATLDEIKSGLAIAHPVHGRLVIAPGVNGATLIDDTYNANPASLDAALGVLKGSTGERWVVLGDMAELGTNELAAHRRAGERAKAEGVDRLLTIGSLAREATLAFGTGAAHYESSDLLCSTLTNELHSDVTLLVKGSRRMQLDKLVALLMKHEAPTC